jgi:hypothetical protein
MSRLDELLERYRTHVSQPLRSGLPLSQRVWFVVHDPEDERRVRNRLSEFELTTRDAGLGWAACDLTGSYADWMDSFDPEERDAILLDPELALTYAETEYLEHLRTRILAAMAAIPPGQAGRTVFALHGLMELYDFLHVSTVVDALGDPFPGVLLVFFPGEREGNRYKFLGAREGWDYLAVPILTES